MTNRYLIFRGTYDSGQGAEDLYNATDDPALAIQIARGLSEKDPEIWSHVLDVATLEIIYANWDEKIHAPVDLLRDRPLTGRL